MEDEQPRTIWNCRIDKTGRISLPSSLRTAMGFAIGDKVVCCLEGDTVIVKTYDEALDELARKFRENIPEDADILEELFAERRADAVHEERR